MRRTHIAVLVLVGMALAACSASPTVEADPAVPPTTTLATASAQAVEDTTTSSDAVEPAAPICPDFEANWPQSGLDLSYTSNNDAESAIGVESVGEMTEVWRHEDIGGVSGTPVIVDGRVYYGDWNGVVHAADACTGERVWSTSVSDRPVATSLAAADGLVVALDVSGRIHGLSQTDGAVAWSSGLGDKDGADGGGAPAIADGVVIVGVTGVRGSVVGFDLATGEERWRVYTDNDLPSEGSSVGVWSSAAVDMGRGVAYIGTGNTFVIRDGEGEKLPDSPFANAVLAIDIRSGELLWVTRMLEEDAGRDFDIGAPPTLMTADGRDLVAVGGKSGEFFALDRETGEEVWRVNLTGGSRAGGVMKAAAYDDGVLYVASNAGFLADGVVFAIDARDGSELWSYLSDPPLIGHNLTIANGVLFAGWYNGKITALDADSGAELWSESLEGPLQGGASISDGYVFVGYGGGSPPALLPSYVGGIAAFAVPAD